MHLYYWTGARNFGDELNPWIWERVAPELFQTDEPTVLVSIGTLLNERLEDEVAERFPDVDRLVVFGTGAGYGEGSTDRSLPTHVYGVRGPRSARTLELPEDYALTDPAILLRELSPVEGGSGQGVSFIPHWQSGNPVWERTCREAGIRYIDPGWDVERVLEALAASELVLAEAMHGAIAADALRVPWVPLRIGAQVLPFKWMDWCDSLGMEYRPSRLPPLWATPPGTDLLRRGYKEAKRRAVGARLKRIARSATPTLSSDAALAERLERVHERLQRLRDDHRTGRLQGDRTEVILA